MRLNGEVLKVIGEEIVVIPRPSGDIVFKARAILATDNFQKIRPVPEAPEKVFPDGTKSQDFDSEKYKDAMLKWAESKTNWLVLRSLQEGMPELTWDTVDLSNPSTWSNYRTELTAAGFSEVEVARIIGCAISANGLDQEKIDRATESFLAKRAAHTDA